ncbi:X-Pro dipeptidase [Acuticoccus sediminis]|uniref:X-Pro dipeptidase n=1 Tax=Acuticoccus sediminis TaxID=2184697 RepID=A0A8B2NSM4_9HYPH|nr:Xaa-Pro peptidase family protein [Acuticoccus sediminis]RAI03208.1 X-Pro dipeptidase [Acuticoccus sediminis]
MTLGVGGSTAAAELEKMTKMTGGITPIGIDEHLERVKRAQALMKKEGISALYLDTSANLFYFTGISLKLTERLHGAIIPAEGPVTYLSPAFEEPKTRSMLKFGDDIRVWQEHEDPTALVADTIASLGYESGVVAVDPATPFFNFDGMRKAGNRYDFQNGAVVTAALRSQKTAAEVALLDIAAKVTEEVHKASARILHEGITTTEVQAFVQEAHRRLGAVPTPYPPLILFGEATAYPHGVDYPQTLEDGDMVLMDIGGWVGGYRSDLTRTYVFGEPNPRQREVWDIEKRAQEAGFNAAQKGAPHHAVDDAARGVIESAGFGKDYALPGLPHRTGHGIGIEVHEDSYIVRGNTAPLKVGNCFSIEPTICIYGEFGIRLEDCATVTEDGPRWFSGPSHTVDDPFGYEA